MDIYGWRLDQHDKQIEGIGRELSDIKVLIAGLPTRSDLRNTTLAIVVAVVTTLAAVAGLFLAASSNQLSAFQAGLSAIQTHVAVTPSPK